MMKKTLFVFALVCITLSAYPFYPQSNEFKPGEIVQTGGLEISNSPTYTHDVIYPETFGNLPRVTIKLTKGSANLEIVEQRVDGFIFKTSNLGYSVAQGAHVEWTAAGRLGER